MELKIGFVPSIISPSYEERTFDSLSLLVPKLTSEELKQVILHLKHQQRKLQARKTNDIIDILDQAIQLWLDPNYHYRKLAEELLPIVTGYDSEMIRVFLYSYLRSFRKEKLQRMVEVDFPNPLVLDDFRPRSSGGLTRAYGPELITHVLSGNVPALPLWSLVSGLLVKSSTLGKLSSSEPLFPSLFVETLKEIDRDLAESIAIIWWKGGEEELERIAFSSSEAVIAYGSEKSIDSIRKKVPPHVNLYAHGHKLSAGFIAKDCLQRVLVTETARRAAKDASQFDQQACLSPHVFFVEEKGNVTVGEFASLLAQEMNNYEVKMPRARLSEQENQAIIQARSTFQFQAFQTNKIALFESEKSTSWTVVYDKKTTSFPISPLNRFVYVIPVMSIDDVPSYLHEVRGLLQTFGVACTPNNFRSIIEVLGQCGVSRVTFLGRMGEPEPGWHHDGRPHLADLVRWVDVEASVEIEMDAYDPNRM